MTAWVVGWCVMPVQTFATVIPCPLPHEAMDDVLAITLAGDPGARLLVDCFLLWHAAGHPHLAIALLGRGERAVYLSAEFAATRQTVASARAWKQILQRSQDGLRHVHQRALAMAAIARRAKGPS